MTGGLWLFLASPWTPLKMSSFGGWGLLAAFLALFCCPGSVEETFEVHMWPEQLMVASGESALINCSTSCAQPDKGGLETPLHKTLLEQQAQWKLFEVFNVSQDTPVICYFICSREQRSRSANISVFHPPKLVLLKLWPTLVATGGWFTIECRVPAVAPLESLTVTLLRGSEVVYSQTFVGTTRSPQEATVTRNTTARREDGSHNFSCRAEMDLSAHGGGLVHSLSDPQALDVYEPVQDNQLVIVITVVSALLLLFVTSVLLCFVFGQKWHQRRTGTYRVADAWRRLRRAHRAQPA
ncbi:intercellular adhesion molecule 2 [Hippopotamus amphibius kiboko]|uniref:intercellular adhesion molecule 2 n=1 Tax=Hippopotamus amphibius kiboko TaxID=575201 RepID=UPI00259ABE52|nr:intercellular adhesion molecule 2 [Hippopotamus amphibius kiboko]